VGVGGGNGRPAGAGGEVGGVGVGGPADADGFPVTAGRGGAQGTTGNAGSKGNSGNNGNGWSGRGAGRAGGGGAADKETFDRNGVGQAAAALTAQQWRIACLAAEGATNREIATQLFLSPRTVDHHMRNIFTRLGIRSRVELARLVAAQPLDELVN
jgi:DNA-binding CsgD family transcriptional regulator